MLLVFGHLLSFAKSNVNRWSVRLWWLNLLQFRSWRAHIERLAIRRRWTIEDGSVLPWQCPHRNDTRDLSFYEIYLRKRFSKKPNQKAANRSTSSAKWICQPRRHLKPERVKISSISTWMMLLNRWQCFNVHRLSKIVSVRLNPN